MKSEIELSNRMLADGTRELYAFSGVGEVADFSLDQVKTGLQLDGAVTVTGVATDHATEAYVDLSFRGANFTLEAQYADWTLCAERADVAADIARELTVRVERVLLPYVAAAREGGPLRSGAYRVAWACVDGSSGLSDFDVLDEAIAYADDVASETENGPTWAVVVDERFVQRYRGQHYGLRKPDKADPPPVVSAAPVTEHESGFWAKPRINQWVEAWEAKRDARRIAESTEFCRNGDAVWRVVENSPDRFHWQGDRYWWRWPVYFRGLRIGPVPLGAAISLVLGALCLLAAPTAIVTVDGDVVRALDEKYLIWAAVFILPPILFHAWRALRPAPFLRATPGRFEHLGGVIDVSSGDCVLHVGLAKSAYRSLNDPIVSVRLWRYWRTLVVELRRGEAVLWNDLLVVDPERSGDEARLMGWLADLARAARIRLEDARER